MSVSGSLLPRTVLVHTTCSCVPKHTCFRNFGCQFPEKVTSDILREVDLVPIPKPEFRSQKEVTDFFQQVNPSDLKVRKASRVVRDIGIDRPGQSLLGDLEEDTERDLEEVILTHIRTPLKLRHTRPKRSLQWPAGFTDSNPEFTETHSE